MLGSFFLQVALNPASSAQPALQDLPAHVLGDLLDGGLDMKRLYCGILITFSNSSIQ